VRLPHVRIVNDRTTAAVNSPSKTLFKIKTPQWSAELTSVNIAAHDRSRLCRWPASTMPSSRRKWWFNGALVNQKSY